LKPLQNWKKRIGRKGDKMEKIHHRGDEIGAEDSELLYSDDIKGDEHQMPEIDYVSNLAQD